MRCGEEERVEGRVKEGGGWEGRSSQVRKFMSKIMCLINGKRDNRSQVLFAG